MTIDWGDGSTPTTLSTLLGQIVATSTPGVFAFSAQHPYLYSTARAVAGAEFDTYPINVSVTNSVSISTAATSIVVASLPPSIAIESNLAADQTDSSTIELVAADERPRPAGDRSRHLERGRPLGEYCRQRHRFERFRSRTTAESWPASSPRRSPAATAASSTDTAQVLVITQADATALITPASVTITGVGANSGTTTLLGSADRLIAQIYGDNDLVDATQESIPVELDGFGGIGLIVSPAAFGRAFRPADQTASTGETLLGGSGDDLLVAGQGSDSLVAGAGDATLVAGSGDDTLVGGSGNAVFDLNSTQSTVVIGSTSGDNTLDFSDAGQAVSVDLSQESGQTQTINTTTNAQLTLEGKFDTYIASPNGDSVVANDDNDLIYALAGNTTISAGSGQDSIVGGSGNDIIYSLAGNATITGGSGNESIVGGSGNDIIYTLSGNTTVTGGSGNESIVGGSGNDIIYTLSGNTTVTGGSGNESVVGGSGNDIIYTLSGNTTITGGSGNESIVGGSGNDIIYTLSGNTTITGGSGNESIVGGSGNDIIYTLSGNATITAGSGNESIVGGSGNDVIYTLSGNTTITGGSGTESITGGSGNDVIYTLSGNTTITGGWGTSRSWAAPAMTSSIR